MTFTVKSLNRNALMGALGRLALVVACCQPGRTASAQDTPVSVPSSSPSAPTAQSSGGGSTVASDLGGGNAIVGGITNGFPDLFKRRLLFRFSLGESYSVGITDQSLENAGDFYTSATASVSYNWQRRFSEYTFDYSAGASRYGRLQGLDEITHSAGFSQTWQMGRRTTWGLSHRFSLTPDFSAGLLRDSVVQSVSFSNPLPRFGTIDPLANPNNLPTTPTSIPSLNPLPDLGSPVSTFVGPPQGSVPFRSSRTLHSSQLQLSHALTARTNLGFGGGYDRLRYKDNEFFEIDQVGVSASLGHLLSARTSLAFSYFGGRLEQPGGFDLTWTHGARIALTRQLSPGLQVSFGYGPVWVRSTGKQTIPLSPVLASLLGTPSLVRDTSASFFSVGWNGVTSFTKSWERTQFGIGYSRGITTLNALNSTSKSDSLSLNLGTQLGRSASISGSASCLRSEFLSVQNLGKLDQAAANMSFSRRLTSMMDFSLFANYTKLLGSAAYTNYDGYGQFGVHFVFHLPRVNVE
jgi:hypothetical protein